MALGTQPVADAEDHLGEVVPAGHAFVAVVVDAGIGGGVLGALDGMEYLLDGSGQVESVGGGATLVEDHLKLGLGGREVEHGLAEVLAKLGVEPSGADDDGMTSGSENLLLAMELGRTIHAGRCALAVGTAGGVVRLFAKDIIGGNLHQPAAHFLHGTGQILGRCGVELLYKSLLGRVFGAIDIGPGGTVDDGLDVVSLDHGANGFQVGDVEVGGVEPFNLIDIGEEVVIGGTTGYEAHLVAELAVGPCDKYIHTDDMLGDELKAVH